MEDKVDCQRDGCIIGEMGRCMEKPLLEGPGGEADGDTVVDIMKDATGEDIGRLTRGTAMGTAVTFGEEM